jgi:toxin YoeB
MAKGLIWSLEAQKNRKEIFEFWNEKNQSNQFSKKLNVLFNEAAELLVKYPNLGYPTDFENVRLKLVRDYWLVYRYQNKVIQILLIWDVRQDSNSFEQLIESLLE